MQRLRGHLELALFVGLLAGCGPGQDAPGTEDGGQALTGTIEIDGSSTVFPISEAIGEEFQLAHPETRVTVGLSGTGGGFKRFCAGEIAVSDASRPITDEERASCAAAGIEFLELPVAYDGLSVVVNPVNDFLQCLTLEELRRVWEPNSSVRRWSDLRPGLPAEEINLYGPGTDSGTFDYFTEAVVGEAGASRTDYQASEDDNVLVQGVSGDPNAVGYFGYAYWFENQDRLRLVGVDGGGGCVLPSDQTIEDASYPLSRPLLIYVSRARLAEPVVSEFVRFYMENAPTLVPETGYHPLDAGQYQQNLGELPGSAGGGV